MHKHQSPPKKIKGNKNKTAHTTMHFLLSLHTRLGLTRSYTDKKESVMLIM